MSKCQLSEADIHELVVHRIYHEDLLFAQRSYTLLSVHAFLATAFSVLLVSDSGKQPWFLLPICSVALIGAVIGVLQSGLGLQTNRAIGFWRQYLKLIETKAAIPFDTLQYEFYETAFASTPFGDIETGRKRSIALYKSRPRIFTSHTLLIGFVLPLLLAFLWGTGLVLMLWFHRQRTLAVISLIGLLVLLLLTNPFRLAQAKGSPTSPDKGTDPSEQTLRNGQSPSSGMV